jgi:hypothetical protein
MLNVLKTVRFRFIIGLLRYGGFFGYEKNIMTLANGEDTLFPK